MPSAARIISKFRDLTDLDGSSLPSGVATFLAWEDTTQMVKGKSSFFPVYTHTQFPAIKADLISDDSKALADAAAFIGTAGGGTLLLGGSGYYLNNTSSIEYSNVHFDFGGLPVHYGSGGRLRIYGGLDELPITNKPRIRQSCPADSFTLFLDNTLTSNYTNFASGQAIRIRGQSDGAGVSLESQSTRIAAIDSVNNNLTVRDPLDFTFLPVYPSGAYEAAFGIPDRTYISRVTSSTFSQDANVGSSSLFLTANTVIGSGDYVLVADEEVVGSRTPATTDNNLINQEVNQVVAVSGSNITLLNGLHHNYTVAFNARITKLQPIINSTIRNAEVSYVADSLTNNLYGFSIGYSVDCKIENCHIRGNNQFGPMAQGFRHQTNLNCSFDSCSVRKPKFFASAQGYGFTFYSGSTNCKIKNCYTEQCRHGYLFFSGACGNILTGNIDVDARISSFDFHGGNATHNLVSHNIAVGGPSQTLDASTKAGIRIGNNSHVTGDYENVISNNQIFNYFFDGNGYGVDVLAQSSRNTVRNNTLNADIGINCVSNGTYPQIVGSNNVFRGNELVDCPTQAVNVNGGSGISHTLMSFNSNVSVRNTKHFVFKQASGVKLRNNTLDNPVPNSGYPYACNINTVNNFYGQGNHLDGANRGFKLTSCPSAQVIGNYCTNLIDGVVFEDAGNNNFYTAKLNHADGIFNARYITDGSVSGTIIRPTQVAGAAAVASLSLPFTTTAVIPISSSTPGSGDGTELLNLTFRPQNPNSIVMIDLLIPFITISSGSTMTASLYRDGICFASQGFRLSTTGATSGAGTSLRGYYVSDTTGNPSILSARIGPRENTTTLTIDGKYGDVAQPMMTVQEIASN